jgi:hypothetical protein
MTSHDYRERLVDRARGDRHPLAPEDALDVHLAACPDCAARLASERTLSAGLRALAEATPGMREPEGMEHRLLAAFEQTRRSRPRAGARGAWKAMAAMAAMLAIAVAGATIAWHASERPFEAAGGVSVPGPDDASASEFVPWPGAASLPPFESGQLVRTELPASVLPLLGIRPARAAVGNRVVADVLVGQDGLARAVRLAN